MLRSKLCQKTFLYKPCMISGHYYLTRIMARHATNEAQQKAKMHNKPYFLGTD